MTTVNLTFNVPDALQPRIVAALRGTYPAETSGLGDLAAFKSVLRLWLINCLAGWEANAASVDAATAATAARQAAASTAQTDGAGIT